MQSGEMPVLSGGSNALDCGTSIVHNILHHKKFSFLLHIETVLKQNKQYIYFFNRPGVAGAILQTPLIFFDLLTDSLILCENIFNKHSLPNRKSSGTDILRERSPPLTCHVSCVTCHMSHVTCHVSCGQCHFDLFLKLFWTKW